MDVGIENVWVGYPLKALKDQCASEEEDTRTVIWWFYQSDKSFCYESLHAYLRSSVTFARSLQPIGQLTPFAFSHTTTPQGKLF